MIIYGPYMIICVRPYGPPSFLEVPPLFWEGQLLGGLAGPQTRLLAPLDPLDLHGEITQPCRT